MPPSTKTELDSFEIDTDFFRWEKVLEAINILEERNETPVPSIYAPYLAFHFFATILEKGYYMEWNKKNALDFVSKLDSSLTLSVVEKHIKAFIQVGLFERESFEAASFLTGVEIQDMWRQGMKVRRRIAIMDKSHDILWKESLWKSSNSHAEEKITN